MQWIPIWAIWTIHMHVCVLGWLYEILNIVILSWSWTSHIAFAPAIPSCAYKKDLHKNAHSCTVHNSKTRKQPECPSTGEWKINCGFLTQSAKQLNFSNTETLSAESQSQNTLNTDKIKIYFMELQIKAIKSHKKESERRMKTGLKPTVASNA